MGILLVYDVTDERSFNSERFFLTRARVVAQSKTHIHTTPDIRNWMRNIEQHASEGVNKILIGNKADVLDKKVFINLGGIGARASNSVPLLSHYTGH